jgi:hypothetical protein
MTDFNLVPVTLRTARAFVTAHHRHNVAPQGHKFSVGIERDGTLVGVAIVGRPIARRQDDGRTVEVTRVCVLDDNRNANSALYSAAWRAARAMGYSRIITYTLPEESGASLRAAGFRKVGMTEAKAAGWSVPSRPRERPEKYPDGQKVIWEIRKGGDGCEQVRRL